MALNPDTLLELLQQRWDWYSARAVMTEMLHALGLEGKKEFAPADVDRLATWLSEPSHRASHLAEKLRGMSGGRPTPAPAPAPAAAAPAPAAVKPTATPSEPKPAPAPAAPSAVEVRPGAETLKMQAPARGPIRVVSARAGTVRWGVNGWKTPPAEWRPAQTSAVEGSENVETKLAAQGGAFVLELAPAPAAVREVNLVVRYEDNSWTKDATVTFA